MKKSTSTLLALPLLFGLTGAAQATLLEIELTGKLDYGYDQTNYFGLGANVDLANLNQTATFRWLIDTSLLGTNYGDGTTTSYYIDSNDGTYGDNPFVTASVTINGITHTVANNIIGGGDSAIYLEEDSDGSGISDADYLYIYGYNFHSTSTSYSSDYVYLYAYDFIDSIINGVDVGQLDGWSTNQITFDGYDYGFAQFQSYRYDCDPQTGACNSYQDAYGHVSLSSASLSWGNGYDNSIPEPASLALLGIGLAGIGVIRRRRGKQSALVHSGQ
ncbi:MAG: PEP-CTERM sorting domain-containing protein [Candidatus Competibacter sp.]|nr:PEP-CTERM sorting domain-containing protein [Candidatus Competibacter sp.]